ncbi:MAG: transcription elongation factor GreA [Bacteroidia bacterium]|nr:transcription elongation factor GreA [Bacteroidia bacterium]MDW8334927.1 transcription elongation factor GreA [Bacteroidia bacterium]
MELSYFTKEGFEKLKAELHDMKTRQRAEVAAAISEAREKGDLSENAEYDAAKEAQSHLEMRISQLEALINNARVIDDSNIDTSKVYVLSTVKVKNRKTGMDARYTLVSPKEANLKEGKISVESPIGKNLLGKSVGDVIKVNVPAGVMELEVLEITR